MDKVRPEQRRVIVEEADLGNAVVEFRAEEYRWRLGKQKRRLPYRVVAVRGNYVDIEYLRHPSERRLARMTLFVSGDLLYTPIHGHGFYEVFRRLPGPAAPR